MTPNHIAIIMDGNRRWATERGLSAGEGHKAGADNLTRIVEACAKRGVEVLTVYALSTENLKKRPAKEVAGILGLLLSYIKSERKKLQENGVRVSFLGQLKGLPKQVQDACADVMSDLKENNRIKCNIMLNYGGRDEIIHALQEIVDSGAATKEINEQLISSHLYTKGVDDPDMIIRTGGQLRLSNFLIWQMSYSELFFTDTLWPDFSEEELDTLIAEFETRTRRFGGQDVVVKGSNA